MSNVVKLVKPCDADTQENMLRSVRTLLKAIEDGEVRALAFATVIRPDRFEIFYGNADGAAYEMMTAIRMLDKDFTDVIFDAVIGER